MFFRYSEAGIRFASVLFLLVFIAFSPVFADDITGELKKWHRITITFDGPQVGETDAMNPFLDYRLWITFTHSGTGKVYVVPGFFAADGDAANTGADSGDKWRVHFTPDETGTWQYTADFITGTEVSISTDAVPAGSSSAGFFDGNSGNFSVAATDKTGDDFRAKGRLEYIDQHFLQFAETGDYFIKNGIDSPENFLAYDEFDGTYDAGDKGCVSGELFLHSYPVHVADWNSGDPTWGSGNGKGIIGAANYIAATHGNSIYMITFNSGGGDGCDVWPWTSDTERYRFDVSKLDQWEIVFRHLQKKGIQLHLVLAERENRTDLENSLGVQRKLYYRELSARFSHHPVLQWNIGEEHNISNTRRRDYAQYIRDVDPYDHPIAIHSTSTDPIDFYVTGSGGGDPIIGAPMYEVSSIQGSVSQYNNYAITLRQETANAGRPWAIYADEQTIDAPAGEDKDVYRQTHGTWGNLMGGGAGVEWFLSADLTLEDFSADEPARQLTQLAVDFFQTHLPFTEMEPDNSLSSDSESFVFYKAGEVYVISLPYGGSTNLDLAGLSGSYTVQWFDPRNGGSLQNGTVTSVNAGSSVSIGIPPNTTGEHWVALVQTGSTGNQSPTADFTYDVTDLNVDFEDLSTDDGFITSWSWDFGDGNTSTVQNPMHSYFSGGTYTVELTVTDDQGASDSRQRNVIVSGSNTSPTADFSFTTTGLTADFTDASTDNGTIVSWDWDFGDGNTSISQNPSHTYASAGTYTATLIVTDDQGATDQASQSVTVSASNQSPVADFTYSKTELTVEFEDLSTDDGTIVSWDWDFGDGNSSTQQHPIHSYSSSGTYTVNLTVTDDQGASDSRARNVTVSGSNQSPVAGFTFTTSDLTANFTDTSTDDGTITGWDWDFGDGNTSTSQNPSHVYASAGTYTVTLTVTDDQGAQGSTNQDVTVSASNQSPVADFTYDATNLTVDFEDLSTDDGAIVSWSWDLGDGNSSTVQNPNHTYATGGTYTVELTVSDDQGASSSKQRNVTVSGSGNQSPTAAFTFTTSDLTATFTDTSTDDGTIASWSWDFGDGNTSTVQNPIHNYASAGAYTVMLTVTDDQGATDSNSQSVTVSEGGGTGAFIESAGMVVMEAENFTNNIARGNHTWQESTGQTGYSGTGAMLADPNSGALVKKADVFNDSPELTLPVDFSTTGSYYVWLRVFAPAEDDESIHAGKDDVVSASKMMTSTTGAWSWTNLNTKDETVTIGISAAGLSNIQIWMREDGIYLDKIVLTTDASFVPSGTGPSESPRDGGSGNQNPVASFTHTTTDLSVDFTDTSTDDGSIVSWSWDFGDGNSSTQQNPSHSYSSAGTYTVNLTVTDDEGASGSTNQDVTVSASNQSPVAGFTFTTAGLTANFTDTSTDDGTIVSWSWDFGDGNTSTVQNPTHTYVAAGSYSVSLTVTDDQSATGQVAQNVTVNDGSGTGAFIESGGMVVIEAENFDSHIERGAHEWLESSAQSGYSGTGAMLADPNSGVQIKKADALTTAPELGFPVDFSTTGSYYFWVRVFAEDDGDNTIHGGVNQSVSASKIETLTYGSWVWTNIDTKGDNATIGITEVGLDTLKIWMREDGIYLDKIVATTDASFVPTGTGPTESPRDGGSGNQNPVAGFSFTTSSLTANFSDASTDDGTISAWSWDFGDGNTSTAQNPSHTYTSAGTYTASLTVTDDQGATGSTNQSVTVTAANESPVADFTYEVTDLTVDFEDLSTDDGTIVSWSWDFGDGNSSTDQNPTHGYTTAGTYSVDLTVTDNLGATNVKTRNVTVTEPNLAPVAGFSHSATDLTVQFTDTSTDDGSIVSWSWDFGDGNTSTDQNPSHTYGASGTYAVTLTVTDDGGLSDSENVSVDVTVADGPFLESGGLVVMEAENYMLKIDRGSHSWSESTTHSGYSGDGNMQATPDNGTLVRKSKVNQDAPELSFDVDFSAGSTFYVWVRVYAEDNDGNSLHAGLNGSAGAPDMEITSLDSWAWTRLDTRGFIQSLSVPSAGVHAVNVWMREDGIFFDKILLTTDVSYTPAGVGPAESPRGSASTKGNRLTDQLVLNADAYAVEIPDDYVLEGNFPNPFNPVTTIRFGLPEPSHVTLVVFDVQGREVDTLVDGSIPAGYHMLAWDATHLSSGVYIYRIKTADGAFSDTGRMVLLK